ncbi:MFS general substrate transporter [Aureobasidium pullulans]|uniref:MFS general substrate transporter n=1 Tax=Aureobasidium pullulans TaxID=5580 RepID=A0A4T0CY36_AURPU|nr:MFS general substrate transporter [Aureobasidium pullulans]THZ35487.1 MFS general substrate transporter [Aureobasidium pullulans]TIA52739.1 MFS general substrate transporter [Aureobasidium pullulans]
MESVRQDVPDYDVVPGTVYLVQGAHQDGFSSRDIILMPTPSSDPRDPLRWSRWRKTYHLLLLVLYSSTLGAITNGDSVVYLNLVQIYHTGINKLNYAGAVMLLLLGVGNVFFVPLSNKFGRRSIYIWTLLLVFVSEIWMAVSKQYGEYWGVNILRGLGSAPFEALPAISISDIYFAHERGGKLGAYVFGLAFGSFVGPVCGGYMVTGQGVRWMYWWGVIIVGALLVLFFFTLEETHFIRPLDMHDEALVSTMDMPELDKTLATKSTSKEADDLSVQQHPEAIVGEVFDADGFRIQYSLWKTYPTTWTAVFTEWWIPLKCINLPAVFWCGLNYGTCVSWLAVMGTTVALIFSPPPYLFSNSDVGLVWFSPLIGSLIGAYFSGPLNDRLTVYLSNRNRGWREPEYRLWAFIPSAIIMPGGLIMYGATAAHGLHWIAPVFGMGLVGFGLSVGGTVTMSYILDSYKEIDTQVITTIILLRNIIGFGISFGIQSWIDGMGLQNTFIFVGCLSFAVTMFAVFFIVFGKRMRRRTTTRYQHLMKTKAM